MTRAFRGTRMRGSREHVNDGDIPSAEVSETDFQVVRVPSREFVNAMSAGGTVSLIRD